MGKVKRAKQKEVVYHKRTAALTATEQMCQAGNWIMLNKLPDNILKSKKKFTVGKQYQIEQPGGKKLNTLLGVGVLGADDVVYLIPASCYTLVGSKKIKAKKVQVLEI